MKKLKWKYQETDVYWGVWSFGRRTYLTGDSGIDERHYFLGPFCFVFCRKT